MENPSHQSSPSGRRKFLSILAGVISAIVIGDRALAAKKPPAKKVVKKPVKKAPVKKAPAKPVAKSTPSASPSPSPSPSATASATPTSTPSATATPSASPSGVAVPADAKALTVAGKNLMASDLAIGATAAATFPKNGMTTSVLVTRIDEKNFVALKPVCTHAGGPVELSGSSLVCIWHNSRFNQRTGEVINGPADMPLPKENVALYGDVLYYVP